VVSPPAAFKDLCFDAAEPWVTARFWATALGDEASDGGNGAVLRDDRAPTIWVNGVPEPKVGKNRVHVDVYADLPGDLLRLGARLLADHGTWAVLGDPEGNEFCVFPEMDGRRGDGPPARVFALCVDSAEPEALARWWASLIGGDVGPGPDGTPRWLHGAAGLDEITMKFVPVQDERVVKNRWHWDVTTEDVGALVSAGATLVRPADDEIRWTVLADPQGNEFCAFVESA
jgi:uncharacterized protein YndB with AHSA1/START domain